MHRSINAVEFAAELADVLRVFKDILGSARPQLHAKSGHI
jgi:hypothetical protein